MPRGVALGLLGLFGLSPLVGCRAEVPTSELVVATRDLGPIAEVDGIQARDGGYSGVAFDRSIWLFGDSILSEPDAEGSAWRHNTWSYTQDFWADDGIGSFLTWVDAAGGPAELFPYTAEELEFNQAHAPHDPDCQDPCGARRMLWPLDIIQDPSTGDALVFYAKLGGEPGAWNFWGIGSSVAIWSEFEFGPVRPVIDAGADEPTLLFRSPEPAFGQAAAKVPEGLATFGCTDTADHTCYLALVDWDAVFDRDAWRFWTGEGWSSSLADAAPVFEGHTMLTVHYNPHVGAWLAIYSEPLGTGVFVRRAPSVTGPWSRAERLFDAEAGFDGSAPYGGLGHAEYQRGGGRFEYVTYYRSTGDWTGELRMVEVELAEGR